MGSVVPSANHHWWLTTQSREWVVTPDPTRSAARASHDAATGRLEREDETT